MTNVRLLVYGWSLDTLNSDTPVLTYENIKGFNIMQKI
jgi:hypothetical protein